MGRFSVLKRRLTKQTPRWFVLIIDVYFTATAFFLAMALVWQIDWRIGLYGSLKLGLVAILAYSLSFLVFKSYKGIIRHTGVQDIGLLLKTTSFAICLLLLSLLVIDYSFPKRSFLLIVFHYLLTTIILSSLRMLYKRIYSQYIQAHRHQKRILIYGAGTSGVISYHVLRTEGSVIHAFVDDNYKLHHSSIDGVKVLSPRVLTKELIKKQKIDEIIISIQNISAMALDKIVSQCEGFPVKLKIVPPVKDWIDGNLEAKQIKDVRIEDLLGRETIHLETNSIRRELEGKVLLVTGAAGSIGGEISRQLLKYPIKKALFFDQAESDMYALQQSLVQEIKSKALEVEFVVGDIRNQEMVDLLFKQLQPDIVFHAAAYKHVPLMESNPFEAIHTNVLGTKNLVDAADKYRVSKFVMVSTDKAVNPTNVMGATKRVAELYVNHMTKKASKTNFVVTRFGNVLGSNGSVIPLFRKQIAAGGPLTVTHREVTRYFMTIPEACQLVLEAGAMANGGEVYVFDMGESIKIKDLAKRMIQLSGLKYPENIDIEICGLRPGEKIFEELLTDKETTMPTHHEKILIAKVREHDIAYFEEILNWFGSYTKDEEHKDFNANLVRMLKYLVPEYQSENSEYESLDKEVFDLKTFYNSMKGSIHIK